MMERYESFDAPDDEDDVLAQVVSTVTGLGIGFLLDSASVQSAFQADQNPSDVAERHQMDRLLAEGLESLEGQEKRVMDLHYQQNVPFVDIAALMGVSKGRISQIHRSAVERIRARVRRSDGARVA